ncbi:MAG: transporter [Spirochaetes bacterium]|nr:transporter [Spirochaetota bacterium]
MLKAKVFHPDILSVLARAGHLATVLISDGNYPHSTKPDPRAPVVWANFMKGVIGGADALTMVASLVPVESVTVMEPERTGSYAMHDDPPIWAEYRNILKQHAGFTGEFTGLQKPEFNMRVNDANLCLVIATAEQAIFANILVTIGVVR